MSIMKTEMPLMARQEGEWSGSYTLVDTEGKILDKYTSHLSCKFIENSCNNYRFHTWHWFENDRLYQRTLVQEERIK